MASALRIMKNTVGPIVLETGVEFGAGYGIGQLYARHSDSKAGKFIPVIAAAGGKIGAALSLAYGGNQYGWLSGTLNGIGAAGAAIAGAELGLKHGRKAAGVKVVKLSKDAALPAGAKELTTIGALPPASPGRSLSWDDLETLTAMH